MAEALLREQDRYICAICLDLLRDPVTIPCGHSYCMKCIDECWNTEDKRKAYSCPQCRETFNSKPSLNRSTVLAEIMERIRDTPQVSESAQSLAGPGDIACDFCRERKFKAVKSCLECQCSYCETHLHPHYTVSALKKHKLVKAAIMATCSKHDKILEVYCRTDQKCVCMHCLLDDHKGHDTVPSAVERNEKQKKLTDNRKNVKQTIQAKEKQLQKITTDITSHSNSAEKAVEDCKRAFTELGRFIETRSANIIKKTEAYQKEDLDQGADLQETLLLEITELQGKDGVQERLLQTEDNIYFLQNFESVCSSESHHSPSLSFKPCCSYTDISKLVIELKQRLEKVFDEEISKTVKQVSDLARKKAPVSLIKVGDRVRVKPSVHIPKHDWGNVTHKSVGVVQTIKDNENLVVDFPGHLDWKGIPSEMELVTDDHVYVTSLEVSCKDKLDVFYLDHSIFKIGSRVRVKASVDNPEYGWGDVTKNSIGTVTDHWVNVNKKFKDVSSSILKAVNSDELTVDFSEHSGWTGMISELELVLTNDDTDNSTFKIGSRVRVKASVHTPEYGWGDVTKNSVGIVKSMDGDELTVDFPEHLGWTGMLSEMELN